jgi:hypothetical protein
MRTKMGDRERETYYHLDEDPTPRSMDDYLYTFFPWGRTPAEVIQDLLALNVDLKKCRFEIRESYGDQCIGIYGERLERPDEIASRVGNAKRYKEAGETREREEFERLSKKFKS